jgi:hypothetical protein
MMEMCLGMMLNLLFQTLLDYLELNMRKKTIP